MARALVYLFICICGMVSFYGVFFYLVHQMNGDTVIGMGLGFLLAIATLRLIEFLKARGAWSSEQGGKAPELR